jgi:hypothetical protein
VATVVVASVTAAGCGWGQSNEAVVVETDPAPQDATALSPAARREVSGEASFAQSDEASTRITPDGISLSVEAQYHEPIQIDGWTAPAHCSFATSATLVVQGQAVASEGFDGPTSNLDDVSGALGTALDTVVATGPNTAVVVVPSTTVPSPSTDPVTVSPQTASGPPPSAPGTTEPPADVDQPALVIAIAAFGHDEVATLQLVGAQDLDSPWGTRDTQPLDGWTPLALAVPADYVARHGMPQVQLDLVHLDGSTSGATLSVDQPTLQVLTEDWVFDYERIDRDCQPPTGEADNRIAPPDQHIFGGPIQDKPTLPAPGAEQPADPVAATEAALAAIRIVYDLSDFDNDEAQLAKADHLEDPDRALEILRAVLAKDIVDPYLDALDPVFDSLVFLSSTEAAVSYQVGPSYHWEIGRVLLIDGHWRVALGTMCRDLMDAAYTCADVVADPRPGPLG